MTLEDMSPTAARRWVAQEMAKCVSRAEVEARIRTEEAMVAMGDRFGLPNSFNAHVVLLDLLKQRRD